ncbi:hypothetical protein AvCA_12360 [Azotobacter vinelandii CA]|uniref:Uncharacterized protein n=2 Tax=Azotobacter vinelandii TaxID=354 RepID=C1DQ11_AZOVD|nr:hypothetical protein Avin_12360 [Azotobacter vinelandii DJ]AGK17051.1 hypothetical protein AvCA_12360 [Azotobacter vinelandii CA]AGK19809.1 hypothetical protein AvCA6_12360 [Azotobacter vinelandii CA6]
MLHTGRERTRFYRESAERPALQGGAPG